MPEPGAVEGITVNYKGKRVEKVTSTMLAFWNAGRGVLEGDQLSSVDPLRIQGLVTNDFNSEFFFLSVGFIWIFISQFDKLYKTQLNQSWHKHVPKSLRFFYDL